MRCEWSSTTSIFGRRFSSFYLPLLRTLHSTPVDFSYILSRPSQFLRLVHGPSPTTSVASRAPYRTLNALAASVKSPPSTIQGVKRLLTNVQLSRAAAKAVRLSIRNNEVKNAFYVVNSLRYSVFPTRNQSLTPKFPGLRNLLTDFKAIDFGGPVSPRLSSHALLHGLIRVGLTVKAARLAELMIRDGIKIRSKTLQAVTNALLPKVPPTPPRAGIGLSWFRYKGVHLQSEILNLVPTMVEDPCTRYALRLVLKARQYRQQRAKDVYQSLISACLLQGEIIVGSLLFVILVKDWQLKKTLSARMAAHVEPSEEDTVIQSRGRKNMVERLNFLRTESIFPSRFSMYSILSSIQEAMLLETDDETSDLAIRVSLQALANLAVLLDERCLPFPEVAPLIRTLYMCPKVKHEVWISKDGTQLRVRAFTYFHEVLSRLISDLPTTPPRKWNASWNKVKDPGNMLPPLNLEAYNSLLHYSLRHRLSPAWADKVLKHMTMKRYSPLAPDITTYNILIRSGTLLRKVELAENALQIVRRQQENRTHEVVVTNPGIKKSTLSLLSIPGTHVSNSGHFSQALKRIDEEDVDLARMADPHKDLGRPSVPLIADSYTLIAYLTHLTSTGHPEVVADILFYILPELTIINHPSWGSLSSEARKELRFQSRQAYLTRAVAYGPHFFVSVLNALSKAGKTGLMERVWFLAKEAERASWIPEFALDTKPWCLPVHAYTAVIQCYAAEARKGLRMRRSLRCSYDRTEHDSNRDWDPSTKRFVRGWARFIATRRELDRKGPTRRLGARQMGIILFRSMMSGAQDVYNALLKVNRAGQGRDQLTMLIPTPDARFFNAALDLFTRQPSIHTRKARVAPSRWRRRLRLANVRYARLGSTPKHWNPLLQEVAEAMIGAGYPIPMGLRYLFIGRWIGTPCSRPRQIFRPLSFPHVHAPAFRPHAIPTYKSRGLPLGRRPRKLQRSTSVQ